MKTKKKRKVKKKRKRSKKSSVLDLSLKNISMKNCYHESKFKGDNLSKYKAVDSKEDTSGTKSPKKKQSSKKVKFSHTHHMSFLAVNNIIDGLNDIINGMEKSGEEEKPKKSSPRKMSCDIFEEE